MSSIKQVVTGNTVFDQEQRMKTLMSFIPLKQWDKVRAELNQRRLDTDIAQLVNDIPEQWRSHVIRHLDENAVPVDERWKLLQRDRFLNDPNKVFPLVATPWLLEELPTSMRSCNICKLPFTRGENMITKACRKHSIHRQCLAAKLNLNENPLHSECDCNGQESSGEDAYPLVDSQIPQELSESMATCNICEGPFENGEEIFTKACGRHSLHRHCLTEKLNENEDPLYGPCDCNTGGYGAPIWRLILDQGKPVTPLPASRIPRLMPRAPTPMPPTYELDEDSQYASSSDLDFDPHAKGSESDSYSSSGSHSDATSTRDWYGWSECSSPPSPTLTEATELSSP
ncbi:hypothetical protein PCL_07079 [Purpureocillium lilacinum]|uniref:RING-type domain-containing protein n=1 Tax=Purpureocillium lilacinum TaxID=33203 RepID=A0A2U3DT98_PURLI|nr:hypothetical protein PCL_07079 [Purpureocillium lilacinum]